LLATSELPFSGSNPHQVLKRIMEGRFKDPLQARPSIGGKLAAIIRRLLELEPEKRYQSARDLERDLSDFVAEMGIESPDEALASYLTGTQAFSMQFREQMIERLTELGEQAQRRGSVPTALDYYNRVLALDEGNARVLASVQRLGRRNALRRGLVRGSLACAVLATAAGGLWIALRPHAPASAATSKPVVVRVPDQAVVPPAPELARQVQTDIALPPDRPPANRAPHSAQAGVRPPRVHPPASTDAPSGPRTVTFNPDPANVSIGVDGSAPRAFGPSFREIPLEPGVHSFKFVGAHDCCIDEEVSVKVPPGEGAFVVAQKLKFRPAGLYVVTDTPANVLVDNGKISGRSRSVIQVPGLSDVSETHRIRVSAEGHRDHVQDVRLQAGQVVTVEVAMKSDS
jgi:serine/threonine-protein kinase